MEQTLRQVGEVGRTMSGFTAGAAVCAAIAAMLAAPTENWTLRDLAGALGHDARAVWRTLERMQELGVIRIVRHDESGLFEIAQGTSYVD